MMESEHGGRPREMKPVRDIGKKYEYGFVPSISDMATANVLAEIINQYVRIDEGGIAAAKKLALTSEGKTVDGGTDYFLHVPKRLYRSEVQEMFRKMNATGRVNLKLGAERYAPEPEMK